MPAGRFPGRVILALGALLASVTDAASQDVDRGRAVYAEWCAECHGLEGRGDGSAASYMLPRPRDFVQARYQIRTTPSGELPTDDDLRRILERGMPGTAMPAWPNLTDAERRDVIAYIKTFSPFFEDGAPPPMDFGSDPGGGDDGLTSGREVYERLECWKCHGASGRGNGQSAPTLEDWRELPVRAADLTEPWTFNGGMGAEAIHTRFLTGLDGTPMPAYSDALEAGVVSVRELWDLAHFVASLGPDRPPRVTDLLRVARVEGALPDGPDDDTWGAVEASYVPLVGQVVRKPRQFAPTVDGLWVQALHDGRELALLLSWNDPSRSPDAEWDEWRDKVAASLFSDDGTGAGDAARPDGVAVQFPPAPPASMERPYFLMGDARAPVILWLWESQGGSREVRGRGLGVLEPLDGGSLTSQATYDDGQWRLMLRRPLESAAVGPSFAEDVAIPVAFFAWDGSSAEDSRRGSISGWYYLYLAAPRSALVYVLPVLLALVTAALATLAVRRAQGGARLSTREAVPVG